MDCPTNASLSLIKQPTISPSHSVVTEDMWRSVVWRVKVIWRAKVMRRRSVYSCPVVSSWKSARSVEFDLSLHETVRHPATKYACSFAWRFSKRWNYSHQAHSRSHSLIHFRGWYTRTHTHTTKQAKLLWSVSRRVTHNAITTQTWQIESKYCWKDQNTENKLNSCTTSKNT